MSSTEGRGHATDSNDPQSIAEFDYELAPHHVAQTPVEPRSAARLLDATGDAIAHRRIHDLPDLLQPGDIVVVNNTRVLPARLAMHKPTGGAAEVLLLEPRGDDVWNALVRPSKRIADGTVLVPAQADAGDFEVTVLAASGDGTRAVRVAAAEGDVIDALETYGQMPLPPYITERLDDQDRYQTVFADRPGSAAAPTAGLHLTDEVIASLAERDIGFASVELVVGLDTFRPVAVDLLDEHHMHTESYRIAPEVWEQCQKARRVVAIGTTTVRALESAAATGTLAGRTNVFIRRPFDFSVVDLLLTNFHLPKSTLLVMIDAFYGPDWRGLYATAMAQDYRFLSFGDAMLLARRTS